MKMKKEQGITLVVLAVTIIVILIIAGTTMATVFGDEGIFNRSKDTTQTLSKNTVISNAKTDVAIAQDDGQLLTKEELKTILENYGEVKEEGGDLVLYVDGIDEGIDRTDIYPGKYATGVPYAEFENWSATTTQTDVEITVTVTHNVATEDDGETIKKEYCRWVYTTSSEAIGTKVASWESDQYEYKGNFDDASYNSGETTCSQELTLTASEVGTYYLHVLSIDSNGDRAETICDQAITVEEAS